MTVQLLANMFFSPTGLDHYCTEYNSVAPKQPSYISQLSLSILPLRRLLSLNLSVPLLCPSLFSTTLHSIEKMAQLK